MMQFNIIALRFPTGRLDCREAINCVLSGFTQATESNHILQLAFRVILG
jgi:hypothetical protein